MADYGKGRRANLLLNILKLDEVDLKSEIRNL